MEHPRFSAFVKRVHVIDPMAGITSPPLGRRLVWSSSPEAVSNQLSPLIITTLLSGTGRDWDSYFKLAPRMILLTWFRRRRRAFHFLGFSKAAWAIR